jgi:tetraprenyl-beta-curcumene synthase
VIRAGLALAVANKRYWPTVAPLVRAELRRWRRRAQAIADPDLRALALERLREVGFNSEVAATLATLAPRVHRAATVRAMVALELLYDYLDGLTELPAREPLRDGRQLLRALTDAVTQSVPPRQDYYRYRPGCDDGGYVDELVHTVRTALAQLPAAAAIGEAAQGSAARCAEAQVRAHAAARLGSGQAEAWARREAAGTPFHWRELLAGAASSVIVLDALIAAAADERTTRCEAAQIAAAYLSICALATMLDSVVDYEGDERAGRLGVGYMRYYADRELLARELNSSARHAASRAGSLKDGAHHLMTMVGVVAYYTSEPGANGSFARPLVRNLHREFQPLITPTLAILRIWRLLKRVRLAATAPSTDPRAEDVRHAPLTTSRDHSSQAAINWGQIAAHQHH